MGRFPNQMTSTCELYQEGKLKSTHKAKNKGRWGTGEQLLTIYHDPAILLLEMYPQEIIRTSDKIDSKDVKQ